MILTFVIRDKLNTSYEFWDQWIEGAKEIYALLNIEPTNCFVSAVGKNGGLIKYKSLTNKIQRIKSKNEVIDIISIYCLPNNYTSLIFDYIVTLECGTGITFLSFNEKYISIKNLDENKIVHILKRMVPDGKGEIFLMENDECPGLYALKANTPDDYKTLKVITQF